jgi:hypothetical protein
MMAADILISYIPVAILAHLEVQKPMNKQGRTRKRTPDHRPAKGAKRAGEGAK